MDEDCYFQGLYFVTFCKMRTLKNLSEQGVKPIISSDRILYRAAPRRSGIVPGTFFAIIATDGDISVFLEF